MILGKKTVGYRFGLPFLWITWFLFDPDKRRPWEHVKIGTIPHECRFEGEIIVIPGLKCQKCLHDYCNIVYPLD